MAERRLSFVEEKKFKTSFVTNYQAMKGSLEGTTEEDKGIIGSEYQVDIIDEIQLVNRGAFGTPIAETVPVYDKKIITFLNKAASIPTDIFEQAEVTPSARQKYAGLAAAAIKRTEDQIKINALTASSTTKIIPALGTDLSVDKLTRAAALLDEDDVPMEDRFITAHPFQKEALLKQEKVTSADYNTIRALVNGQINTFMGFTFKWVGNRREGGIPWANQPANIRLAFAWHKGAMLTAWGNVGPTIDIFYENKQVTWFVQPYLRAGALAQLPKGVVRIECDQTPPTP